MAEIAGNLISVYFEQRQQRHKLEAETAAPYGQPKKPLTPRPTRSVPLFRQPVPATLQRTGPLKCPSDNIKADYCTASLVGFCSGVDILCVRWYLQIKLNLRNLVEMMAERGPVVAHATVMRWVQRYAPEFEERGARFARSVGRSWRVDEKYVKIRGEWCYLYRAGDRAGGTIDFRLSAKGAVTAVTAFYRKVNKSQPRAPLMITQVGCAACHRAVRELKADGSLPADTKVRASKYLNNLIERSHRAVRQRITAMLGLKSFGNARIAGAGIPMRSHSRGTVRIGAARTFKGEPRWHSWERGAWCVKSPPKIKESVSSRRLFAPAPS